MLVSTVDGRVPWTSEPLTRRVGECRWWLWSYVTSSGSSNRVVTVTTKYGRRVSGFLDGWVGRVTTVMVVDSFGGLPVLNRVDLMITVEW